MNENEEKTGLFRVCFNDESNCIMVPTNDSTLYDRFLSTRKKIFRILREAKKRSTAIMRKAPSGGERRMRSILAAAEEDVRAANKAIGLIDDLFGAETVRKFFREAYLENEDFLPGDAEFEFFFEKMNPVLRMIYHKDSD